MDNKTKFATLLAAVNSLSRKMEQVDYTIYHDADGIVSHYGLMQDQLDENTTSVNILENNQQTMRTEVDILKGLVQKHSEKLHHLNEKVTYLSAKSMEKNITISNLEGDVSGEHCKQTVLAFLRDKMNITLLDMEIMVAHRVGAKKGHDRLIVARCQPDLKERILQNAENLKGKKKHTGRVLLH